MDEHVLSGLFDELEKISGVLGAAGAFLHKMEDPIEVGGLGILAAPSVDNMVAKWRARRAGLVDPHGKPTEEGIESKRLIKEKWHDPIEAGGLGLLAAPIVGKWVGRNHLGGHG